MPPGSIFTTVAKTVYLELGNKSSGTRHDGLHGKILGKKSRLDMDCFVEHGNLCFEQDERVSKEDVVGSIAYESYRIEARLLRRPSGAMWDFDNRVPCYRELSQAC
jgi:hypothetical protein